jgi:hypothetical protein
LKILASEPLMEFPFAGSVCEQMVPNSVAYWELGLLLTPVPSSGSSSDPPAQDAVLSAMLKLKTASLFMM